MSFGPTQMPAGRFQAKRALWTRLALFGPDGTLLTAGLLCSGESFSAQAMSFSTSKGLFSAPKETFLAPVMGPLYTVFPD